MTSAIHKRPVIILPEILWINQPSSVSLYSVKEWERVHARSVQSVKEEALGQIPKGYPLKFFVDGGKILQNNQLRTNALELPGQTPREAFIWCMFWGSREGGRGVVIVLRGGYDGYDVAAPQSLSVFLLVFWNCRCAEACTTAVVNGTCWGAHFHSLRWGRG